jgi:hypothetical protein
MPDVPKRRAEPAQPTLWMGEPPVTETKKTLPPYVSYVTFKNGVRGLVDEKGHMPDRIDDSCLPTMAGGTRAQFLVALRSLRLIDAQGAPGQALRLLAAADDNKWSSAMESILKLSYPDKLPTLATGSMKQLRETFDPGVAGSVLEKSIRFLLAAADDAGIPVSSAIKKAKLSTVNRGKSRAAGGGQPAVDGAEPPGKPGNKPADPAPAVTDPLLAKFPAFDPAWTPEIQTKWFDAFEKLMKMKGGG